MGRHSAPDADDEVDVADAGDVVVAVGPTGRHGRDEPEQEPFTGRQPELPTELPTEQTTLIPLIEAAAAADADSAGGRLTGLRAAELEPILPGEAVVPPPPGELDALNELLAEPTRKWRRRPKPARTAEPPVEAPVEAPAEAPVFAPTEVQVFAPAEAQPSLAQAELAQAELAQAELAQAELAQAELAQAEPAQVEPAQREAVLPDRPAPQAPRPPAAAATPPAAGDPPAGDPAAARVPHGTHADLQLLRADAALRARCLAALLVPFALYVVVMLIVGGHGVQWLLWIWAPTVSAGVLVGVLLDLAHRRAATDGAATDGAVTDGVDRAAGVSGS